MVATLKLKPDGPEYHFDFTFMDFSKEAPSVAVAATPAAVAASPVPAAPAGAVVTVNSASVQVVIPDTVEEIVAQIRARDRQIRELIDAGRFPEVWLPAFEAKDLALAMNAHATQMPTYKQKLLEPAIKRLLNSAWMLDAFGDLGNRDQITAAYADFRSAVSAIESLMQATR